MCSFCIAVIILNNVESVKLFNVFLTANVPLPNLNQYEDWVGFSYFARLLMDYPDMDPNTVEPLIHG